MPHPVPIIIGTTLAVIGSGYAFKKFIYDPHLAPFIDALIAQHRVTQQQRHGYEPIPVPVPHPHQHQQAIPPSTSGRSSAVDSGQHRVSRRRRPAEMYELDETRIMVDDEKPQFAEDRPPAYHPPAGGNLNTAPQPRAQLPHHPYQPREMRRPLPAARSPPVMAQVPNPVVIQPTPRRMRGPPAPMLINMDAVVNAPLSSDGTDTDQTPITPRSGATISAAAPVVVAEETETEASSVSQAQPLATANTVTPAVPVEQVVARVFNAEAFSVHNIPSLVQTPSASPPASCQTARDLTASSSSGAAISASPRPAPVSLAASPAPLSVSNLSHLVGTSRIGSTSPQTFSDDLEIISVSGATTSYIDAETYTPHSPRSPATPATPMSRAMSPPVHIDSIALGGFAQPSALSADNLSLSNLNLLGGISAPVPLSAPSVSSWGEDEQWRSDSEWDALSDAGAGLTQ